MRDGLILPHVQSHAFKMHLSVCVLMVVSSTVFNNLATSQPKRDVELNQIAQMHCIPVIPHYHSIQSLYSEFHIITKWMIVSQIDKFQI